MISHASSFYCWQEETNMEIKLIFFELNENQYCQLVAAEPLRYYIHENHHKLAISHMYSCG
jgi:hypothetical protein